VYRRLRATKPAIPVPISSNVPGSGVGDVLEMLLLQPVEMVLVSSVTAPLAAKALPQPIVAPVFRVMLVSARIFPRNEVVVPRVAELPTSQYTPGLKTNGALMKFTTELDPVISVLDI